VRHPNTDALISAPGGGAADVATIRGAHVADSVRVLHRVLEAIRHARPEDLPGIAANAAAELGATDLTLYLVDYGQTELIAQPRPDAPPGEPIPIDGTLAGRVFTTGEPQQAGADGDHQLWLPLTEGNDRVGVVAVQTTAPPDPAGLDDFCTLAALFAELLFTRRLYSDSVERTRRRLPMQLAAEIIWNLLPPLTYATPDLAISAILEPCYDIGGDAFDYAVNGDTLHVAIFDAVGHGIGASAITALAISAYRNARRCGLDLTDTYRSVDKWVHAQHPDAHVTAVLGELDARTGRYRRISAGHPGELLLRDGRLVKELNGPTALPLGLGYLGNPYPQITEEALQPGDTLLLYTDGVIEARTDDGEFFSTERLIAFLTRALADQLPAPETLRRLVHAILAHQHETLQDDATAALVEWRPRATYGKR
jgi:sigma-B regulation protein RsbU (phosphoserine phosphatase)